MREAEQMTPEDEYSERLIANGCVISSLCYFILSATVSVLVVVVRLVENGIIFYAYVDDERDLVIRLISNFAITCGTLNMTISFVLLCFRNPQFRAKIAKKLKLSNCVTEGEAQSSRQNKTTAKQDKSKCTNQKKQDDVVRNRINQLPGDRNNSSIEQQIQMRKLIIKHYGASLNTESNRDDAEIITANREPADFIEAEPGSSVHPFSIFS